MKNLLVIILFLMLPLSSFAADLVHPLDFTGTNEEKVKVIEQIKVRVRQTFSKLGMDDNITLRMMEKEELRSFKKLTKVGNHKLLDEVTYRYCKGLGLCSYSVILMMYEEEEKASKEELAW